VTAYFSPGDTTLTMSQLRELEGALNTAASASSWRHKVLVLPPGSAVSRLEKLACSYCKSAQDAASETCRTCGAPRGA
jgi:hypothetical protein